MFERENRNLRENRDAAISEKDRAVATERDCSSKYQQLMADLRSLQICSDSKTSELHGEAKMQKFEAERSRLLHEDTLENLQQSQTELEKHRKKIQVLTKEYYDMQTTSERRVVELETKVTDLRSKLDVYEKLEKQLDDIVMQAADNINDNEAERVLFSYGYGANVPSTAKRRLQHSVHLARRVLQLERTNTTLTNDLDSAKAQLEQLGQELSSATSLLDQGQQPYHYLIESIHTRDSEIADLKHNTAIMESHIKSLKQERVDLIQGRNQMSADLERLLNKREDMAVLKQALSSLHKGKSRDLRGPRPGPIHIEHLGRPAHSKTIRTASGSPPRKLTFKEPPPKWYNKLKEQNTTRGSGYAYATGT